MLTQAFLVLALGCSGSANANSPTWSSAPVENDRNFSESFTIELSPLEQCTVFVRKDGNGIRIHGSMIDECEARHEFRVNMMRARMVNQKTELIILFFDNQLKKNGAPAPFSAMDKFLKHIETLESEQAKFFLRRYPEKLTTYTVLISLQEEAPH
jgi:hypothetical protein